MDAFADPLRITVALPLRETYYPLGYTLQLATNSPEVLRAAAKGWCRFQPRCAEPMLELRMAVDRESAGPAVPPLPEFRAQKHLLAIVADAHNFAICDYERAFGFAWLEAAAVRDPDYVSYSFLEAMACCILAQRCLTPVHAACVARGGRAVLLCGGPGAGKSTLSYACARAGWTLLSDNESWLERQPGSRVVLANPHQIRFRESAVELFPELKTHTAARHLNGKLAIVVPTSELPDIRTAFQSQTEFLVFLDRDGSGPPGLHPMAAEEARLRLLRELPVYDQWVQEAQRVSIDNLVQAPAFELRYHACESALEWLERLVAA